MTKTKHDLVTRVSDETALLHRQVSDVVQMTLDCIVEFLARGDRLELRNFGVFEVKIRRAGVGHNPFHPNRAMHIPPRAVVLFRPGMGMRSEVLKLTRRTAGRRPAVKSARRR